MSLTNSQDSSSQFATYSSPIKTLAVVGFVFLVGIGIVLAIYMAQFVPVALHSVDTATATLSRIFTSTKQSTLTVVPSPTTLPFSIAATTTTQHVATKKQTIAPIKTKVATKKVHKKIVKTHVRAGKETHSTYLIGTTTPALYGFPDLTTHIISVGYLTSTSTNSFVSTTTIPHNARIAIKFSIKNIGTNKTGQWKFRASIPTSLSYIFNSPVQKSLNPGDHIDYMLGFDQAKSGSNQTISITANATHTVAESNTNNNSASVGVTILGN